MGRGGTAGGREEPHKWAFGSGPKDTKDENDVENDEG